ncbi:nicotinate-nucleotide diphosphorylase (carboxylating) [Sorochytrium milnesiophthora]
MSHDTNFAHLLPPSLPQQVAAWLAEDIPSFDYGGYVVGEAETSATLWQKSDGVLAGVPFVNEVFRQVQCSVEWHVQEGTFTRVGDGKVKVATVRGNSRQLLVGERTALNTMARCSGIATRARRLADLKAARGFKGVIAGTRKTTPGFRVVEKYGMLVGGVDTHRMDLSSMIMLKDNHVWSQGSITRAVARARQVGGFALKIEVECRNEAEAEEAIAAGADVIMLDNYHAEGFKAAAATLKQRHAGKRHFLIEGSGGITEETVADYFGDQNYKYGKHRLVEDVALDPKDMLAWILLTLCLLADLSHGRHYVTTGLSHELTQANLTLYSVQFLLSSTPMNRSLAFGFVTSVQHFKIRVAIFYNALWVDCKLGRNAGASSLEHPVTHSERFIHDDFLQQPHEYAIAFRARFADSRPTSFTGQLPDEARLFVNLRGPRPLNMSLDGCAARFNRSDSHAFVTTTTTYGPGGPPKHVKTHISRPAMFFKGQATYDYVKKVHSFTCDPENMTGSVPPYTVTAVNKDIIVVEHGADDGKVDPKVATLEFSEG